MRFRQSRSLDGFSKIYSAAFRQQENVFLASKHGKDLPFLGLDGDFWSASKKS
jgi:hypothetical protein